MLYNSRVGFLKRIWSKALGALGVGALLLVPLMAAAQAKDTSCVPSEGKICNPVPYETVNDFIKALLTGILKIGIPLVALAIIYCGFLFVAARGNPEKITKARDALMYTLIGAAILLGAWAIATLIANTVTSL